jgi:hypothetical protein
MARPRDACDCRACEGSGYVMDPDAVPCGECSGMGYRRTVECGSELARALAPSADPLDLARRCESYAVVAEETALGTTHEDTTCRLFGVAFALREVARAIRYLPLPAPRPTLAQRVRKWLVWGVTR